MSPIDRIFKDFYRVLQHYQCPEGCHLCCTYSPIQFELDEYNTVLKSVSPESKSIIKCNIKPASYKEYYRELPSPCPLLSDKCTIYNNRPQVCQRYPFEILLTRDLAIRPCALGIQIINDYKEWSGDTTEITATTNEVPTIAYVFGTAKQGTKNLRKFARWKEHDKTLP